MLVLEEATEEPFFRGREIKGWQFDFGGLVKSKRQGVTIVLLEVENKRTATK